VRPQAGIVEADGFAEGIITAAMGIAGQVIQSLQLAKNREVGRCAQRLFEFGQGGDFVSQQVLPQGSGIEGEWAHNVIVPSPIVSTRNYNTIATMRGKAIEGTSIWP
jgi:hypothetical protein